jgi:hypothetical protein
MTKATDDKNIRLHQMPRTFAQNFKQIGGFESTFGVKKDNFTFERHFDLKKRQIKISLKKINFRSYKETNLRRDNLLTIDSQVPRIKQKCV